MATTNNITVTCSKCGRRENVSTYGNINVSEDPELKSKIKDGSLFISECPHCGTRNLITAPMLYHDPSERLMIWLGGSDDSVIARLDAMFRSEETLKGYTARLVGTPGDLIEKVNIFDAGLDDIVMEMCKYVTCMESGKDIGGMRFVSLSGADNEITLTYPQNGQMEMIGIGFNVYEDCAGIVRRNPAMQERAAGLVRVDREWIATFFR